MFNPNSLPEFNQPAFEALAKRSLYAITHEKLPEKNKYDILLKEINYFDSEGDFIRDYSYYDDLSICQILFFRLYDNFEDCCTIEDCLDYQYEQCIDKNHFLKFTKTMFIDYCQKFSNIFNSPPPPPLDFKKHKFVLRWFDKKLIQFENIDLENSNGDVLADFQKIKLTEKVSINEITTYFENLKGDRKIDTSIENIKRVLMAVFVDSNGLQLKKSTLDTYFNKSKLLNRSKK